MKKILVWAIVGVMAFAVVPTSASAHCGSRNGYRTCNYSSCTRTGVHKHNGTSYRGHYNGDGHGQHH